VPLAVPVEVCLAREIKPLVQCERKKFLRIYRSYPNDLRGLARTIAALDKNRYLTAGLGLILFRLDSPQIPGGPNLRQGGGAKVSPLFVLLKYARIAGVSTDILIDDKVSLPK